MARRNQNKQTGAPRLTKSKKPGRKRRSGRKARAGLPTNSGFLGASGPGFNNLAGKGVTRNMTSNKQEMHVIEDEYIAEVTVAGQPNFNNVVYSVNPGNATTFPWLSTLAKNFEKYEFDYLEFYYKREVSEYATNGQVGKVMFGYDTDASDPPPTTKQQIEDTDPHVDALPSENMSLVIPPHMLKTRMNDAHYVRPGAQPAGTDIKTYDIGNLNVATQNIVNNVSVGELHVRYVCRLMVPVLEASAGATTSKSSAWFQSTTAETAGATGVAKTLALATASTNGLGIVNTAGSFVPPAGNYLITASNTMIDSGSAVVTCQLDVQKNGATVFTGSVPIAGTANGADLNVAVSVVLAFNGTTDAVKFIVTDTYTGTVTNSGSVTFLAVQ